MCTQNDRIKLWSQVREHVIKILNLFGDLTISSLNILFLSKGQRLYCKINIQVCFRNCKMSA